jgi:hypothetical protein
MGRIRDRLKATASQLQLTGPTGWWAQGVSEALDQILQALEIPSGGSGGGSGGGTTLDLDILETKRSGADQIGVTTGDDVILNNTVFVRGSATYDFNTGIYTLIPGKVYELDAGGAVASFSDAAGGFLAIDWVDAVTNTPLFGNITGIYKPSTQTNASSNGGRTRAVFIPAGAGDARVKLRITDATGTAAIAAGFFGCVVKQLR